MRCQIGISDGIYVRAIELSNGDSTFSTGLALLKYYTTKNKVVNLINSSDRISLGRCFPYLRQPAILLYGQYWQLSPVDKYLYYQKTETWYIWPAFTPIYEVLRTYLGIP